MEATRDSRYFYQNEFDKACFQHLLAYGDFKNLNGRTFAYKVLHDKTFNIAKDPKYEGHRHGMVYKSFDKRTSGSGIKNENF